jgi:hypothetical protein
MMFKLSLITFFFTSACFAQNFPLVKILEVSNSGRTIILNIGEVEGLRMEDYGVLIQEEKDQLNYLASGSIKKLNHHQSLWFLDRPIYPEDLSAKNKLRLGTSKNFLGRKKKIQEKKLSFETPGYLSRIKNLPSYVVEVFNIKDLTKRNAIILEKKLNVSGESFIPEVNDSVSIIEVDNNIFDPIKSSELKKKSRESKQARLDTLIKGSVSKINNKASKLPFYHDLDKFSERSSVESSFDSFIDNFDNENNIESKYSGSKKYLDPLWQGDLSDKDLREYFLSMEKRYQKDRGKLVTKNLPGNEIFFRLGYSFIKHTSEIDQSFQSTNKSISFGYEWHLMRVDKSLRYFGLELGIDITNGHYEIRDQENFETGDLDFRVMLNLYLNGLPSEIGKFIWYLGGGGRLGSASVTGQNLSGDSSYFKTTFPSGQLGFKYRINGGDESSLLPKIGVGLGALLTLDYLDLSLSNKNFDNLRGSFSTVDFKFLTGVNFYF